MNSKAADTKKRAIFKELPKPAVQHLSTCLELFPWVSRYRIWLMTLPEMGAGCEFDTFVYLPGFLGKYSLKFAFRVILTLS